MTITVTSDDKLIKGKLYGKKKIVQQNPSANRMGNEVVPKDNKSPQPNTPHTLCRDEKQNKAQAVTPTSKTGKRSFSAKIP
ncbi:hypothetical protein FWF89_00110 [Candidatus Saccharibacteria bacterium]|nr:hypothetical protein [Candidatus Saccharibacteria bacterium]